jgi:hypothetical protein
MCPNLAQVAISKYGIFWPIKTDSYISIVGNKGQIVDDQALGATRLEKTERFPIPVENVMDSDASLILQYDPNNTNMVLSRIVLENMRDSKQDCISCKGFFEDILVRSDKQQDFYRRLKYPDSITLNSYSGPNDLSGGNPVTFEYPEVSTQNSPPILSYGGYERSIVNNLGVNIPYHPSPGSSLPIVTGHPMSEPTINGKPYHLCHLKQIPITGHIVFEKGVFHPQSGWCISPSSTNPNLFQFSTIDEVSYTGINNKTSSLKFNTGNRKTFTFNGPGFTNLEGSYDAVGNNLKNLYSSSISLSVSQDVAPVFAPDSEPSQEQIDNQEAKEIPDIDIHHGYRNLNNGIFTDVVSDEYIVDANQNMTEFICSSGVNGFNPSASAHNSYTFTTRGGRLARPTNPAKKLALQGSETLFLNIQDIEVKLNFLNYVNTKNLVVWLEADLSGMASRIKCGEELKSTNRADSFFNGGIPFDNLNVGVSGYLQSLKNLNASVLQCPEDYLNNECNVKLKLFLLNKEHIQNNQYNVSLHFSDHVPNTNSSSNKNIISSGILHNQTIENNTIHLQPTIIPTGYSDLESIEYNNIVKTNQLNINYNKFAKFNGLPLFIDKTTGYKDSTIFTLKIAVLDENDEMRIYDNLKNNDLLSHYKTIEEKQKSSQIYNSLCSWDLIIHTSTPTFTDKDSLGLIDYSGPPSIPGYNFIADFKNQKHRLPLVNINAPNTYLNNLNLCSYDDPSMPKTINQLLIEFPTWAILNIIAEIFIGSNGTILGTLLGDTSVGYNALAAYFSDLRQQATLTEYNRYIGKGNYDRFGFGSPEKALLNISKDGLIWYKLEAAIFKYTNSHILNNKKYKFIHLHKDIAPLFSSFKFKVVQSFSDIFDVKFTTTKNIEDLSGLTVEEIEYSIDDFISVEKQDKKEDNGLYLIKETEWIKLEKTTNIPNKIIEQNNLLNISMSSINITDQKNCLLIEGKRAFHIFNTQQNLNISIINKNYPELNELENTILYKGWIFKDNKHYTLLVLNRGEKQETENKEKFNNYSFDTSKSLSLNKNESDVVLIYQNNPTKIEESPLSKWGLEKSNCHMDSTPEQSFSTIGEGSYGTGSNFLRPNILSNILQENKIKPIYDILNNRDNDRYKKNKITLILPDGTIKNFNSNILGFALTQQDFEYITTSNFSLLLPDSVNQDDPIISKQLELIKEIANQTSYKNLQNYSFMDIKCMDFIYESSFTQRNGERVDHGELLIENDFEKIYPTKDLTTDQITILSDRLNFLYSNSEEYSDLQSYSDVGINFLSIQELEKYFNLLPEDDLECYKKDTFDPKVCIKSVVKQQLRYLYQERNEIISLLEEKTIRNIDENNNTIYSAKSLANGILPYYYFDIVSNPEDSSLKIIKKNNSDYYWINIDPNQQCQLATDKTVKILTKVKYKCISTAFNIAGAEIIGPEFFHVCPKEVGNITSGADENFSNSGNEYTYSIPDRLIEAEKKRYPKITSWKEGVLPGPYTTRNFSINAGGPKDIVVLVTETYLMPGPEYVEKDKLSSLSNVNNKVKDILNLDDTQNLFVEFRNIPRKLKGVDQHYDKITPTRTGSYGGAFKGVGANINNELMMWKCIDKQNGADIEPPDYYKLQNEMIFRAFFGSSDGVEHKNTSQSDNKDPWEWIPYEYVRIEPKG